MNVRPGEPKHRIAGCYELVLPLLLLLQDAWLVVLAQPIHLNDETGARPEEVDACNEATVHADRRLLNWRGKTVRGPDDRAWDSSTDSLSASAKSSTRSTNSRPRRGTRRCRSVASAGAAVGSLRNAASTMATASAKGMRSMTSMIVRSADVAGMPMGSPTVVKPSNCSRQSASRMLPRLSGTRNSKGSSGVTGTSASKRHSRAAVRPQASEPGGRTMRAATTDSSNEGLSEACMQNTPRRTRRAASRRIAASFTEPRLSASRSAAATKAAAVSTATRWRGFALARWRRPQVSRPCGTPGSLRRGTAHPSPPRSAAPAPSAPASRSMSRPG